MLENSPVDRDEVTARPSTPVGSGEAEKPSNVKKWAIAVVVVVILFALASML